jgi:hypothetical protein
MEVDMRKSIMDSSNRPPNADEGTVFSGSLKVRDKFGRRLFSIPLPPEPDLTAKSQTTVLEAKNEKPVKIVPSLKFKVAVGGILALALFPPIRLNESGYQYLSEQGYNYDLAWKKVQLRFLFGETAGYGSVALGHLLAMSLVWSLSVWLLAPYTAAMSEKWTRKIPRDKTAESQSKIHGADLQTIIAGIILAAGAVSIFYLAVSQFLNN